jgi:hypothetical protein
MSSSSLSSSPSLFLSFASRFLILTLSFCLVLVASGDGERDDALEEAADEALLAAGDGERERLDAGEGDLDTDLEGDLEDFRETGDRDRDKDDRELDREEKLLLEATEEDLERPGDEGPSACRGDADRADPGEEDRELIVAT